MDVAAGLLLAALFFYVATDDAKRPIVAAEQDYYDTKGVTLMNMPLPPDSRERRTPLGEAPDIAPTAAYMKGSPLPVVMVSADQRNIRLDNWE